MRSEKTLFDLIPDFARKNAAVHPVWLNGSRARPGALKDIFRTSTSSMP